MIKRIVLLLFILLHLSTAHCQPTNLPLGYKQYYTNTCSSNSFLNTLSFTREADWKISTQENYTALYTKENDSLTQVIVPVSRGFLSTQVYGEFIMELEFRMPQQTKNDSNGFYLLCPVKNCQTYYAFCFTGDSVYFSYIINGKKELLGSKPFRVDMNKWYKIIIERDMLSRDITIKSNNPRQHIQFNDSRLVMGYVGFGSQNVNNHLRNISIWAPTAITGKELSCE